MATIVICHGAFGGGWAWRRVRGPLRAKGHEVFTPTLTGLGERHRYASPLVGLTTHIDDVTDLLFHEDLSEVVLLGHSYGGMVATGVADRMAERIAKVIYLDAFVPEDGQCLLDFDRPSEVAKARAAARTYGAGWLIPPVPLKTFEEPVRLTGAVDRLPRTYIYCARKPPDDVFAQFAARLKDATGWTYREMDWDHRPNATAPDDLADLIDALVGAG